MFGYRIFKAAALDAIFVRQAAALDGLQQRAAERERALMERIVQIESRLGAARGMADLLMERKNTLEIECAAFRQRYFGMPQVAPQIGKSATTTSDQTGVGPDLFEDVGDDRAVELRALGLIDPSDEILQAGADDLAPGRVLRPA